ncbi:MAG TPA: hypothetical protein VFZ25_07000 [Chloroflexota bacterium]|nr:hypothetical protein [Chloroflexota bacterium]
MDESGPCGLLLRYMRIRRYYTTFTPIDFDGVSSRIVKMVGALVEA